MTAVLVLAGVFLLAMFWAIGAWKRLVSLRQQFRNSYALFNGQYERHLALIATLADAAEADMPRERSRLADILVAHTRVIEANAHAADPTNAAALQQLATADAVLNAALGNLPALFDARATLKANPSMLALSMEWNAVRNRVAFTRQAYSDAVLQYNAALAQFPGSVIANLFGFKAGALLVPGKTADATDVPPLDSSRT
ncbi:LemA protein [Actimicrobium sp. GrIS 1.19]|uniref:LemA family protein n=1 Tax=Actimicrobium sp. GrIS 1.19 TaxID=3071708 RepID=UPI002E030A98|nr:LemA protein [Actimicrobium sp. GrIS 1.19]